MSTIEVGGFGSAAEAECFVAGIRYVNDSAITAEVGGMEVPPTGATWYVLIHDSDDNGGPRATAIEYLIE
jgi:hypothetical protein